jgi:hypothetical protein
VFSYCDLCWQLTLTGLFGGSRTNYIIGAVVSGLAPAIIEGFQETSGPEIVELLRNLLNGLLVGDGSSSNDILTCLIGIWSLYTAVFPLKFRKPPLVKRMYSYFRHIYYYIVQLLQAHILLYCTITSGTCITILYNHFRHIYYYIVQLLQAHILRYCTITSGTYITILYNYFRHIYYYIVLLIKLK